MGGEFCALIRGLGCQVAHIRAVKIVPWARAVRIVYSNRKVARDIEHVGSAHDDVEFEPLKTVAQQKLRAGQGELDLLLQPPPEVGGQLWITGSRMGHLWDALCAAYDAERGRPGTGAAVRPPPRQLPPDTPSLRPAQAPAWSRTRAARDVASRGVDGQLRTDNPWIWAAGVAAPLANG